MTTAPTLPGLERLEEAARTVYRHMTPTAQHAWPLLTERTGAHVVVKHENHTPIGAFKVRGGLTYLTSLLGEQPDCPGVVTATRGNHGQSIARAATALGVPATILVPHGNNPEKNAAMRAFGAELIEHGHDFQAAAEYAAGLADERGLHMVKSFDMRLVEGVASYPMELFRAFPDLDTVYLPIGMGSGICATIAARDALGLTTKIVGVVSEHAPSYKLSFEAGHVVGTNSADTIADGVACRSPDATALAIIRAGAERVVAVSDDAVLDAMQALFVDTHNVAEGAGALGLAALLSERDAMAGKSVGLVMTGGNADRALLRRAMCRGACPNIEGIG